MVNVDIFNEEERKLVSLMIEQRDEQKVCDEMGINLTEFSKIRDSFLEKLESAAQ